MKQSCLARDGWLAVFLFRNAVSQFRLCALRSPSTGGEVKSIKSLKLLLIVCVTMYE